jgi:transketolase
MEGVSHEAAALAGMLAGQADLDLRRQSDFARWADRAELQRRCSGALQGLPLAHAARADGNDLVAIEAAIENAAKAETGRPSIIAVRTVIGYGSPKAGTNKVHGEAMGAAVAATKKFFGFPEDQSFYVPDDALANWRKAVDRGASLRRSGTSCSKATRRPIRSWRRSLSGRRRAS